MNILKSGTEERIETAWLGQKGRTPSKIGMFADGYKGSDTFAALVAVSESPDGKGNSARNAVENLRDAFAGGVAYGVQDALKDAVSDVGSDSPADLSFAAAAVLKSDIWIYSTGTCRVYRASREERGRATDITGIFKDGRIHQFGLDPGQSFVLATKGLGILDSTTDIQLISTGCRKPLQKTLTEIVENTGVRFNEIGGCAAAVRYCRIGRIAKVSLRRVLYTSLFLAAVMLAFLVLCDEDTQEEGGQSRQDAYDGDVIMPLN